MNNFGTATRPAPGRMRKRDRTDPDSAANWPELLSLIAELIKTVDESLAQDGINFSDLFENACGLVSFDHPFLDPDTDVFRYSGGYISVRQRLSGRDLGIGVVSALVRIMQRLSEDGHHRTVSHRTVRRLRRLVNRRKKEFDLFDLLPELQKINGI